MSPPPSDDRPLAVDAYIDAIPAGDRPLFDRLERLIDEIRPGLAPRISYNMLCWKVEHHRLYVGAWKHGLSIYGWSQGREIPVTSRHPQLKTSKGTIRLTAETANTLTDDELRDLIRAALADPPA